MVTFTKTRINVIRKISFYKSLTKTNSGNIILPQKQDKTDNLYIFFKVFYLIFLDVRKTLFQFLHSQRDVCA